MFNTISKGGTGVYVLIISQVLALFGIDAPEGTVVNAVEGFVQVIALVLLVWSQLSRKDLILGFFRRVRN